MQALIFQTTESYILVLKTLGELASEENKVSLDHLAALAVIL
jgi:hypothetical protein